MDKLWKKKAKGDSPIVKRDCTNEMTLLILGCTESGKTTIWRQLQLISDDSIQEDKKHFQKLIYGNTITSINKLLEIAEKHNLPISEENKEKQERVQSTPASMAEFKLPRFPLRLVYDFKCVWEDDSVQQAFKLTQTNPDYHTPGRMQYYMDNIFRTLSPDFRPGDLDILSVYESCDTVQTAEIYYRKIKINSYCYPGAVSDAKKWETLQEPADVVVYIINLSDYDQYLPENKSQNKLLASINSLTDLLTSKCFKTCSRLFVLLNCLDLFKEKSAEIDLKCCFSEYADGLDSQKALAYVHTYLTQKLSEKEKPIKIMSVCALEKETFTSAFDEIIDTSLPALPIYNTQSNNNNNNNSNNNNNNNNHVGNGTTGANGTDRSERDSKDRGETPTKEPKEREKEKEKSSKKKGKRIASMESGFEAVQGRRKTMEDKHVIMDNVRPSFATNVPEDETCAYYAVYDGHGGGETSKIVEDRLHKDVLLDPNFPTDVEKAVKNGFLSTDTYVLQQPSKSGSTAVIAVIVGTQLLVANAGDSECIICKTTGTGKKTKTEHVLMSYKHVPTDENEKLRISAAGGLVVFGRLFGSLAVSRSFGDRDYKDGGQHFVSAEPHIKQIELTPEDQFLVMACDGLWDKLSYEDVVGTVSRLRKEGKGATEICKVLVQDAITKESMDNISVVLTFFNWKK